VLGGDGTAEGSDKGKPRILVPAVGGFRGDDVDVHVAVRDVAERDDLGTPVRLGDHVGGGGREPHPLRGRSGDVELDRDA
jgi:hypothetical protein